MSEKAAPLTPGVKLTPAIGRWHWPGTISITSEDVQKISDAAGLPAEKPITEEWVRLTISCYLAMDSNPRTSATLIREWRDARSRVKALLRKLDGLGDFGELRRELKKFIESANRAEAAVLLYQDSMKKVPGREQRERPDADTVLRTETAAIAFAAVLAAQRNQTQ